MTDSRIYVSRRGSILEALTKELKKINGSGDFLTTISGNVHPKLVFWDEVTEYPAIYLNAGREVRVYQGGGYKERYLQVNVRIYVEEEDAWIALDKFIQDVETVLENAGQLDYIDHEGKPQTIQQITILSIDTDEGVLEPLGVGEVLIEVRY